jgi:hypothetical protein
MITFPSQDVPYHVQITGELGVHQRLDPRARVADRFQLINQSLCRMD